LGDSHTFGINLNTQDNYPSQLHILLNEALSCSTIKKFEVINLGVQGYDFQYMIERYKIRGKKYNPDLLLWLVISDDFRRINEVMIPKLRHYTQEAKKSGEYQEHLQEGRYYTQWNKARDETVAELGGEDILLKRQKNYIKDIATYFSGNIVFVSYEGRLLPKEENVITTLSTQHNTFYHDHIPNIYTMDDTTLPDLHPNKKGYEVITQNIMNYLVKNKLLPCRLK
jgi:hypothetical protein